MRYQIYANGEVVNTIEASETFVADYCARNGYTFEADPLPGPVPQPDPTLEDRMAAMEAAIERGLAL